MFRADYCFTVARATLEKCNARLREEARQRTGAPATPPSSSSSSSSDTDDSQDAEPQQGAAKSPIRRRSSQVELDAVATEVQSELRAAVDRCLKSAGNAAVGR